METAGVLALYRRSVEKYGLRYIPYIGDGDSKGYSVIDKEKLCFHPKGGEHFTRHKANGN